MKKNLRILSCFILFSFCRLSGQTVNIGFESTLPGAYTSSNAVSGWTLSNYSNGNSCINSPGSTGGSTEFSIVSTPIPSFPTIGNILHSSLGGSNVALLNSSTGNASATRLSKTFTVSPSNQLLRYAYAGVWQDGGQGCCDQPGFRVLLKDAMGTELSCLSQTMVAMGSSCQNGITGYSVSTARSS